MQSCALPPFGRVGLAVSPAWVGGAAGIPSLWDGASCSEHPPAAGRWDVLGGLLCCGWSTARRGVGAAGSALVSHSVSSPLSKGALSRSLLMEVSVAGAPVLHAATPGPAVQLCGVSFPRCLEANRPRSPTAAQRPSLGLSFVRFTPFSSEAPWTRGAEPHARPAPFSMPPPGPDLTSQNEGRAAPAGTARCHGFRRAGHVMLRHVTPRCPTRRRTAAPRGLRGALWGSVGLSPSAVCRAAAVGTTPRCQSPNPERRSAGGNGAVGVTAAVAAPWCCAAPLPAGRLCSEPRIRGVLWFGRDSEHHPAPVMHVGQLEGWSRQQGPTGSGTGCFGAHTVTPQIPVVTPTSVCGHHEGLGSHLEQRRLAEGCSHIPTSCLDPQVVLLHGTHCPLPPTAGPCSVTAHPRAPAASSVPPGTGARWKPSTCVCAALEALRVSMGRVYWLAVPSRGHFYLCNPFPNVEVAL